MCACDLSHPRVVRAPRAPASNRPRAVHDRTLPRVPGLADGCRSSLGTRLDGRGRSLNKPAQLLPDPQACKRDVDPHAPTLERRDHELAVASTREDNDRVASRDERREIHQDASRPGSALRDRHRVQRRLVRTDDRVGAEQPMLRGQDSPRRADRMHVATRLAEPGDTYRSSALTSRSSFIDTHETRCKGARPFFKPPERTCICPQCTASARVDALFQTSALYCTRR